MRVGPRLVRGTFLFAALLLVWIILDGTGDLIVGAVAAALGAWVGLLVAPPDAPSEAVRQRLLGALAFAGYFLLESFRGAVDVGWRAVRRDLPIDPHLIRYRVSLPPGPARTLLAGALSLLPGTLTADTDDEGATLTIHAITSDPLEAVRALEARIAAWFALPREGAEQEGPT